MQTPGMPQSPLSPFARPSVAQDDLRTPEILARFDLRALWRAAPARLGDVLVLLAVWGSIAVILWGLQQPPR